METFTRTDVPTAVAPVMTRTCLCRDCGKTFTLSTEEQQWYLDKGYVLPERCPACRTTRRENKKKFRQSVMDSWFANKEALSVFLSLKDEFAEFLKDTHPDLAERLSGLPDQMTEKKEEYDA